MGPAVVPGGSFDILSDEVTFPAASQYHLPYTPSLGVATHVTRNALQELPVGRGQCQNAVVGIRCQEGTGCAQDIKPSSGTGFALATDAAHQQQSTTPSDPQPAKTKLAWRSSRHRRPPVEWETFEPLDAVIEETSFAEAPPRHSSPPARSTEQQAPVQDTAWHCLPSPDANYDVQEQIEKHLAGQFEWLMTYPASTTPGEGHCTAPSSERVVYGCNMLRHTYQWSSPDDDDITHHPTKRYALIATPLRDAAVLPCDMDQSRDRVCLASSQPPWYPNGPLKAPELMTVVEEVLSPSLSAVSDRSGSFGTGSARNSSFSVPRIEDSLEELDKLEDELDAVNAATLGRELSLVENKPASPVPKTPSDRTQSNVFERASIPGQSLTVRAKKCERTNPMIRRAASLTLRDQKSERTETEAEHKATVTSSRDKAANLQATPRSAAKSQKPLTVPKFELPGDAVAKRLREQREARQAQQAETHSEAQAAVAKQRAGRSLTKPKFELPGEAISRRKREEREVKLRAEEEEERKKREFKARPVRHSIGPATMPRETAASRARQNRTSQEDAETQHARVDQSARTPAASALNFASLPTRGRNSMVLSPREASRALSISSGASGRRSTLSVEELEQQRLRSKENFARVSVLVKDRDRDRRERESTAKLAREQAAERSRIASREWAEKKRLKEAAVRAAAKQTGAPPRLAAKA